MAIRSAARDGQEVIPVLTHVMITPVIGKAFRPLPNHAERETMKNLFLTKAEAEAIVAVEIPTTVADLATFNRTKGAEREWVLGNAAEILIGEGKATAEGLAPSIGMTRRTLDNYRAFVRTDVQAFLDNGKDQADALRLAWNARAKERTAKKNKAEAEAEGEGGEGEGGEGEAEAEAPAFDRKAVADAMKALITWVADHADATDDEAIALVMKADEILATLV